jgi:hypothetical protein
VIGTHGERTDCRHTRDFLGRVAVGVGAVAEPAVKVAPPALDFAGAHARACMGVTGADASAPERPVFTGKCLSVVVPSPSCPKVFAPQALHAARAR